MRSPVIVRPLTAAIALFIAAGSAVPAQEAADLFDPSVLHEIRLSIANRDLQQLRETYLENTYYAADIQWGGVKLRNVGIRSRGRSSRDQAKLGLQVDFNRYITGQRFLGLKALVLDNLWQDPTMIRERISMAVFARMGLPAPRVAFAKVFINNEYLGVYGLVEAIDSVFLKRTFGESEGFLFEYKHQKDYHGAYLGDELDPYKRFFEPRTNEKQPDSVLYSPFRDMFREVSQPRDSVWHTRLAEYIDVEQLLKYVAVESYLTDDDGFLGADGMSNFYVYRAADSNVHRLIPWDKDLTLRHPQQYVVTRVEENELFRRLLSYRSARLFFYRQVEAVARSVHQDDWLRNEVTQSVKLIAAAAQEDALKPVSNEDMTAALRELAKFVRQRSQFVRNDLKALKESGWKPAFWDASERPSEGH